jgi:hypothetical protein
MEQERWVVCEEPQHDEMSWHKTKERAIERAQGYHRQTGRGYTVDLELVRLGRGGAEPVASYPDQWAVTAAAPRVAA